MTATPPPTAPSNGMLPWGLGLLGLIGVPFANLLVSGIVMVAVGATSRRRGGLAAENGRRAANWGLTLLLIDVVCIAFWIVWLSVQARGFLPGGLTIIVWAVLGLANLVAAIVGLVQAGRGQVVTVPAIPFLRRPSV